MLPLNTITNNNEKFEHVTNINIDPNIDWVDGINFEVKTATQTKNFSINFLRGTFELKDRIKELKDYKEDFVRGNTMRSVAALLLVGIYVACIAAMILGGPITVAIILLPLIILTCIVDLALRHSIFYRSYGTPHLLTCGIPNPLAPITAPIFLAYSIITKTIEGKEKIEKETLEIKKITNYVSNNKIEIKKWFKMVSGAVESSIDEQMKNSSSAKNSKKLKKLYLILDEVKSAIEELSESSRAAKVIEQ